MATLDRPGLSLHYALRGNGPPLLLVAGLASDASSWLTVGEPLASRFLAITPDNRGAGRTRPQDGPVSIDAMADDCAALLDHLSIARAHVLGHSMGGFVAQRLALRHPARVDRLVLVATGAAPGDRSVARFRDLADRLDAGEPPESWFPRLFALIFTRRFLSDRANADAALRWAIDYPYPQCAAAFRRQCDAIAAFDGSADLTRIAAPALVIAGREDLLFSPVDCAALADRLRGAACVVLEGAAHAVHTEQPKAFVAAVASFLAH
ncbi:MAG: alpha/beta fold hydrolase [Betaproteobacteria bacterium]